MFAMLLSNTREGTAHQGPSFMVDMVCNYCCSAAAVCLW
jgi:hypothetical protein